MEGDNCNMQGKFRGRVRDGCQVERNQFLETWYKCLAAAKDVKALSASLCFKDILLAVLRKVFES